MGWKRRLVVGLTAAVTAAAPYGSARAAEPPAVRRIWASAAAALIHPGVQTYTNSSQCTANFVFTSGSDVFLGQAAHCSGTGSETSIDGCTSPTLPEGTKVNVDGAGKSGVMVYNSWYRMQAGHEVDPETCMYNDLALIRLDRSDWNKVNPSMPFWGGPTGVASVADSGPVYSYGNSELRFGITVLSPKLGFSIGATQGGWSETVYTVTPGIPGDSGSAFLDSRGRAVGVLSTFALAPVAASNGVGSLARELEYARAHGFADLRLVPGDVPFSGAF